MHLDTKTTIAGQPAIKVRDFLRQVDGNFWKADFAQNYFNVTSKRAQEIINELSEKEYIRENKDVVCKAISNNGLQRKSTICNYPVN